MKKPASILTLLLSLLAIGSMFAMPIVLRAADPEKSPKKKADDADLRKYDKNQNGKLDPDEEAARQADLRKEKDEKEKKKKG